MDKSKITNGAKIKVLDTGLTFHTFNDWGLVITNTDCIGEPILYEKYIEIPGAPKKIDLSEALTGSPVYKSREIKIVLSGVKNHKDWDRFISEIRTKIHGKECWIFFDNDPYYYNYRGRVHVTGFSSLMDVGTFTISIPEADPYRYTLNVEESHIHWENLAYGTSNAYNYTFRENLVNYPIRFETQSEGLKVYIKRYPSNSFRYVGDLNVGTTFLNDFKFGGVETILQIRNTKSGTTASFDAYFQEVTL